MYCQNCGKQIKGGVNFCPFCGQKVVNTLYCYKCGKQIDNATDACPFCGAEIYSEKNIQEVLSESVGKFAKAAENAKIKEKTKYCFITLIYFFMNLIPLLVGSCVLTLGQYYSAYYWLGDPLKTDVIIPAYTVTLFLFIAFIEHTRYLFRLQDQGLYSIPLSALIKVNKVLIYVTYPLLGIRCLLGTFQAINFWGFDTIMATAPGSILVGLTPIGFCVYCKLRLKYNKKTSEN